MRTFSRAVAVFAVATLPGLMFGQTNSEEPIKTTLCDLVKAPKRFNGKMVQVRATVIAGFEASLLQDKNCSIWFTAGFSITMTLPNGRTKPTGPPITLKKDAE
jgi:hypothetical protein